MAGVRRGSRWHATSARRYAYGSFYPQGPNFQPTAEVFPGFEKHRLEEGMMWPNDLPGLGIDVSYAAIVF